MKYRAEIDGLRALAVIPVILFHAGFDLFSGGFVGVDVFFVISGYLITTILIEDIEKNCFSLVNFYERRARRILPALFFVMLVCIPFAWMWMLPSQLKDFSQSLVAVSFFASNILFWKESDYFGAAAEEKPLLHTWSLAVEEQYYVLFPIFLLLTWRFGKNRVFWIIVVMAAMSLLLSEWGWRNKPLANFYLAPTRAWELFAGSIAAFIVQKRGVQKNNPLALLGLGAVIFSIFAYDKTIPFPSVYALIPVIGVMLLVLFAAKETLAARLLSTRAFVGIGLISYSAYLWHQPLFAFARIGQVEEPSEFLMASLSLASLLLAGASWKYIEGPFREKSKLKRKAIFSFSLIGISVFMLGGSIGSFKLELFNFGQYHKSHNLTLGAYNPDNVFLQEESWSLLRTLSKDADYKVSNNAYDRKIWFDLTKNSPKVLVIGNSHSKDLYNILSQSEYFNSNFQIARYGTQLRDLSEDHPMWEVPNYQSATHILIATRYNADDLNNLSPLIEKVIHDGKSIVFVKNIFEFPDYGSDFSLIDKVVLEHQNQEVSYIAEKVNAAYYEFFISESENRSYRSNRILSTVAEKYDISILDRMDYMCISEIEICLAVQKDLTKNFYDYGHHTLSGVNYFANSELLQKFLIELTSSLTN